ncbi:MAG: LytTR family DNA-binding domain-containing protein, partial [Chromatocurvus sp.]
MTTNLRTAVAAPDKRRRELQLWFYIGVPLLIGFFLGWTQVGRAAEWPKHFSLLYWLGVSFGSLFFLELLTPPFAHLLRPRGVPLWITLIIAQIAIGWLAILPVIRLYTEWVQSFLPVALAVPLQDGSLGSVLQKLPTNIISWVSINLLFFHWLGLDRFGYQPPGSQVTVALAPSSPAPEVEMPEPQSQAPAAEADAGDSDVSREADPPLAFLTRVREDRRGALLALQAEGHYLRVYTDAGSDLVLYRLSDALGELCDHDGMRVHRSWWVADRAVAVANNDGKLTLVNGMQ